MQKKQAIIAQIRDLGLERGDTVFVSSDLLRVGYFNKNQETTLRDWVDIFEELLGTIIHKSKGKAYLKINICFIQQHSLVSFLSYIFRSR